MNYVSDVSEICFVSLGDFSLFFFGEKHFPARFLRLVEFSVAEVIEFPDERYARAEARNLWFC